MYVYIRTEPQLWTVGFYSPDGEWHPESDWSTKEEAAERVHYLNGGGNRCPNREVKKDLHPLWDDVIKQTEEEGPEALIQLVKDRLEAWADSARIVWNGSGSEAAKNEMENYTALAYALGKALMLMRQKK